MKLAIIGGGAAGFFTAIECKSKNSQLDVSIFEAGAKTLTKVLISGGGRCNVTHNLFEPKELSLKYPRGQKELFQAFHHFQPKDTIEWFKQRGVKLIAEADGRMFPSTNKSSTIIECFQKEIERLEIKINTLTRVDQIQKTNNSFLLTFKDETTKIFDSVVIATGSMPMGHELAKSLGHKIIDPVPSLFTALITDPLIEGLEGLSFPSAEVKYQKFIQRGPILITHWGLSGPAQLKLSAFAARELFENQYQGILKINWVGIKLEDVRKHLLSLKTLDEPQFGLPKRFWQRAVSLAQNKILPLAKILTECELNLLGQARYKQEFTTCGGVARHEVDFKTMESKLVSNLFFAGEVLDVDGITGGFNFQNAWTNGYLISQRLSGVSNLDISDVI